MVFFNMNIDESTVINMRFFVIKNPQSRLDSSLLNFKLFLFTELRLYLQHTVPFVSIDYLSNEILV